MAGIARRRGGGDQGGVAAAAGGDGEAAASGFSRGDSSATTTLRSPASSSLTDDGGEVTSWTSADGGGGGDYCSFSCSSESELELESDDDDDEEEEEMMQLDGGGHAAGGPLYELAAPLLAQLPLRAIQVLPREVPILHIALQRQVRPRPCKEDNPLHHQDEAAAAQRPWSRGSVVEFASRSRALQQDDGEEGDEVLVRSIAVKSKGAQASSQQQQHTCTTEQERAVKMLVERQYRGTEKKMEMRFFNKMNSSAISTQLHWS
uniref:Uncharacterized protein n=1 Tax=Oryza rufipogon TaxID=4529 RepID=A0A0E0QNB8_ORYRU